MTVAHRFLKGTVAAFLLLVMFSGSGQAQEADLTDESELLDALSQADPAAASRYDKQLRSLWSKSGSSSADFLLKRGRDAMEANDYRAAIEHLTALTDHAPQFAEGWHARASAYFAADLFGPAVADLERALALNPNHYEAMLGMGLILESVKRPEAAYKIYVQGLSIHPHHEQLTNAKNRLASSIKGQSL